MRPSLAEFPGLPEKGMLTLCEVEGTVHSVPAECAKVESFTTAVSNHPSVCITKEVLHHTPVSREEIGRIFLPGEETFFKKLISCWYEQGFLEAVQTAANYTNQMNGLIVFFINVIVAITNFVMKIRNYFHPHLRASGEKLIIAVSQTKDWSISPVRCLDWHPHTTKLAIAAWDDSMRIYSTDTKFVPVLKCKDQTAISCLAWRPYLTSDLAVGCSKGVFLWTIDPNSVVARPSVSCAQLLEKPGHGPVTSLSWSPQGDILMTSSAADSSIYLWEIEMEHDVVLKRYRGGGICLTAWSPDGSKVFAATSGIIFRVWDSNTWTQDNWYLVSGRVQTACWSSSSSVLLFATTTEPFIYALAFNTLGSVFKCDDTQEARIVVDLTPVEVDDERIGGLVTCITWDKNAHHLAVMFRESNYVAVFRTEIKTVLKITPCCFINGLPGETANVIHFQKNFDEGAVLTIAWSTGRIQHFPFVYTDLDVENDSVNPVRSLTRSAKSIRSKYEAYSPVSPIYRSSPFNQVLASPI